MTIENKTKNKFLYGTSYKNNHELGSKFSLLADDFFDNDGDGYDDYTKLNNPNAEKLSREEKAKAAANKAAGKTDTRVNYDNSGKPTGLKNSNTANSTASDVKDFAQSENERLKAENERIDKAIEEVTKAKSDDEMRGLETWYPTNIKQAYANNINNKNAILNALNQQKSNNINLIGSNNQLLTGVITNLSSDGSQTAVDAQLAHAQATVDAAVEGKLGAIAQADASKYGARLQALGQAVQGMTSLEQARIQAEGGLQQIIVKGEEDFVIGVKTKITETYQNQIASKATSTYQQNMAAKLNASMYQYTLDSADHLEKQMNQEAYLAMAVVNSEEYREKIIAKYKEEHEGKLQLNGKEITPDDVIKLVRESIAVDIFKKYESKLNAASMLVVNDIKYNNNSKIDGAEFYLLALDEPKSSNIYKIDNKKPLNKIKSRKQNPSNQNEYIVEYYDADGNVHSEKVAKSRLVAKLETNQSGLEPFDYFITEEKAKETMFNSSGSRVDLFFGPFKSAIMNNPNLSEEEKEKKLMVAQNSLEAIFGGDSWLKGLVGLLISGQWKLLKACVKEVIGSGKRGFDYPSSNNVTQAQTQPQPKQQQTVQLSEDAKLLESSIRDNIITTQEIGDIKNTNLATREGLFKALEELVQQAKLSNKTVDQSLVNSFGESLHSTLSGVSGGTSVQPGTNVAPIKDIPLDSEENKKAISVLVH